MKNAVGRDILEEILQTTSKGVFRGSHAMDGEELHRGSTYVKPVISSGGSKLPPFIKDAPLKYEIKDGMTLGSHHHFREGDKVLNVVMEEIHELGIRNIIICASLMSNQNNPVVYIIGDDTITNIQSSGMRGRIDKAISERQLQGLAIMRSHGGCVRAIESGEAYIDIAFIGAPTADEYGDSNTSGGEVNCGALSYSAPDALYADEVVTATDCLVPLPNWLYQISQIYMDYAVMVDGIGDPSRTATGATKPTSGQREFLMASYRTKAVKRTSYFKDGFSCQTGVDGASVASTILLADVMRERNTHTNFSVGGIMKPICQLLEEGLTRTLVDTQGFNEYAIQSATTNPNRHYITASEHVDPFNKGTYINRLDFVILAALEVDVHFNCDVVVGSSDVVSGAQGGHPDTAVGAKCIIMITPILQGCTPSVCIDVTTATTPGEDMDVVTTNYGVVVNLKWQNLIDALKDPGFSLKSIEELRGAAYTTMGEPERVQFGERVVGTIEAYDSSIMDVVHGVKPSQFVD